MQNNALTWKLINEEHVVQDEWIDFRRNEYKLPNDSVIGPVYNYSKHSFSLIVAIDEKRPIYLRQTVQTWY